MFSLDGKTALVTGASGGIGGAIAAALHAQGATVALSGTRTGPLEELRDALGERAAIYPCNLSETEEVGALPGKVAAAHDGLDILVNNAGVTRDNLFMRMKDEEWDAVLTVNLGAIFRLCRASLRGMMKARWGRIVNIGSVVGTTGNPGQANYCAAKAGLVGLSKSLAWEVASRNITVNVVAPGFIRSAMTDALTEDQKARILAGIPVGAMGEGADIGAAVAYLASDAASYVTGQTLHVNGGMAMI